MKNKEINRQIAQLCGELRDMNCPCCLGNGRVMVCGDDHGHYGWSKECLRCNGQGRVEAPIPDYCGDLNAMEKAERELTPTQRLSYCYYLTRHTIHGVLAPAQQRAEAFLKITEKKEPH